MVDRTFLPFWQASIAAHIVGADAREAYLEGQIAQACNERVRARMMTLKRRMMAGPVAGEGRVLPFERPARASGGEKEAAPRPGGTERARLRGGR